MNSRIFVADDEKEILNLISVALTREGYEVSVFENGDDLLSACDHSLPSLVILDVMMPGTDGLSVCASLRMQHPSLPILILSVKGSPLDRVTGLTLGCDDYMTKPFLLLELSARVRALLRRARPVLEQAESVASSLTYGPLKIYPSRHEATINGEQLPLTPSEFDFLSYLVRHADTAVSREEILKTLWQVNWQTDTRAADDLVKRLRRKLRAYGDVIRIETVWGYGFRLSLGGNA